MSKSSKAHKKTCKIKGNTNRIGNQTMRICFLVVYHWLSRDLHYISATWNLLFALIWCCCWLCWCLLYCCCSCQGVAVFPYNFANSWWQNSCFYSLDWPKRKRAHRCCRQLAFTGYKCGCGKGLKNMQRRHSSTCSSWWIAVFFLFCHYFLRCMILYAADGTPTLSLWAN